MTDLNLKVGDRVKARNGVLGTVIETDRSNFPYGVVWEDGAGDWYTSEGFAYTGKISDDDIIEVIGHRQYVDTPFEVGKTYPTKRGKPITIKGFYLWGVDGEGYEDTYSLDGRYFLEDGEESENDLIPTSIEDKPQENWLTLDTVPDGVVIGGKRYRLTGEE